MYGRIYQITSVFVKQITVPFVLKFIHNSLSLIQIFTVPYLLKIRQQNESLLFSDPPFLLKKNTSL